MGLSAWLRASQGRSQGTAGRLPTAVAGASRRRSAGLGVAMSGQASGALAIKVVMDTNAQGTIT